MKSDKKTVVFLFNENPEEMIARLIEKYLPENWNHLVLTEIEEIPKRCDLVIPWNYQKVIKNLELLPKVVIFHGSDLPYGRGWAPIAHTFLNKISTYALSALYATTKVDAGAIICKAKLPIYDDYTASFLRQLDNLLMLNLTKMILENFNSEIITGKPQETKISTYYKRRRPEDNEVSPSDTLSEIIPLLRSAEKAHPAFFFLNGTKYILQISPAEKPKYPIKVEIEFAASGTKKYLIIEELEIKSLI